MPLRLTSARRQTLLRNLNVCLNMFFSLVALDKEEAVGEYNRLVPPLVSAGRI